MNALAAVADCAMDRPLASVSIVGRARTGLGCVMGGFCVSRTQVLSRSCRISDRRQAGKVGKPYYMRSVPLRPSPILPSVKKSVFIFLSLIVIPLVLSTVNYLLGDRRENWQTADRSSADLLPKPSTHLDAVIRVYAARTVRWRGIFAVHTWIVVKERGAPRYSRYDYTAWGEPIRVDGFAADGRWFGAVPEAVAALDGEKAEA